MRRLESAQARAATSSPPPVRHPAEDCHQTDEHAADGQRLELSEVLALAAMPWLKLKTVQASVPPAAENPTNGLRRPARGVYG